MPSVAIRPVGSDISSVGVGEALGGRAGSFGLWSFLRYKRALVLRARRWSEEVNWLDGEGDGCCCWEGEETLRCMTYGALVDVEIERWKRYREEEGTPRLLILAAMVWNLKPLQCYQTPFVFSMNFSRSSNRNRWIRDLSTGEIWSTIPAVLTPQNFNVACSGKELWPSGKQGSMCV